MTTDPAPARLWQRYERIQAFKQLPTASADGVNYARVVAPYLYDASTIGLLKKLAFGLVFAPKAVRAGPRAPLLIYYSHRYKRRRDYDYIVDRLREVAGVDHEFIETAESLSPIQWWFTLRALPLGMRVSRGLEEGWPMRLGTAVLVAKFASLADRMYRGLAKGRTRIVTFSDAHPHDNLLAQLGHVEGAATVTAQHGQYRLLDAASMSADAEAYANFVSDLMLVWGEATRAEFERFGISRDRLLVTGWIRHWPVLESRGPRAVFGVMLNGGNGAASNPALLDAARRVSDELGWDYVVRSHPNLDLPEYRRSIAPACRSVGPMGTQEFADSVDFCIGHASSAALEMLLLDIPVYLLDDGRLAPIFRRPELAFPGVDELLAMIRSDLGSPNDARSRLGALKRWFNDDADQPTRLRAAVSPEEA